MDLIIWNFFRSPTGERFCNKLFIEKIYEILFPSIRTLETRRIKEKKKIDLTILLNFPSFYSLHKLQSTRETAET